MRFGVQLGMRVGMLGAGVGRRLGDVQLPPKILLRFGGRTLLERHVEILRRCGVRRVDLVVGFRAEEVEAEIARIGAQDLVRTCYNPHFEEGAIISFWTLKEAFTSGEPVIFMDGDVLYDHRMMERLLAASRDNCFLMDRRIEDGEDPVKLCMRDGVLVDFHKRPERAHEWWGEWVGFCRFAPEIAAKTIAKAERIIGAGRRDAIYEDAIRNVLLDQPPGTFGVEDITGLPWVEIDFPEDLERARREVFPSLIEPQDDATLERAAAGGGGMTTLVTGATGFVGSAVARRLLERGETVRVLARPGGDRRNIADLKVELVEGDLGDPGSLERALKGCRALFHVAADYRLWAPRPDEIYQANVAGTRRLMELAAAAGVGRIVYTSSVATLGINPDGTPSDEATPVSLGDMIGHYKRSKFLAEREVDALVRERGLPAVIVNPSTPVGPRDVKPTPTGRMIVEAAAGRMPAFVDTGLNVVHVDDVAAGHLLALDRGVVGERYVLGGENMALGEILAEIARLCGRRPPRLRIPHNAVLPLAFTAEAWSRLTGRGEPFVTVDGVRMAKKRMFFSSAKARDRLGYRARPARGALADAVGWFRAEGYLA